ncbi:MAG: NAD(P)-binding protein [Acidimicrobiia bacterium]
MAGPDAVIVGSGPNGLTAAAKLALSGKKVLVIEAAGSIGGGTRSSELTEPGFIHDVCSAIHPFGVTSPAFRALSVPIDWVTPPIAMAHPLDDGTAVALHNSVAATASQFEGSDGKEWAALVGPLVSDLDNVVETFLAARILPNPFSKAARIMGVHGSRSSVALADRFGTVPARALIAGSPPTPLHRWTRPSPPASHCCSQQSGTGGAGPWCAEDPKTWPVPWPP